MMWVALLVLVVIVAVLLLLQRRPLQVGMPPELPGLPFLGNALQYRNDALALVLSIGGDAVTLNMAGQRLVLLCSEEYVRPFFTSRALSSASALEAFGFTDALGMYNVEEGPRLHAAVLRAPGVLPTDPELSARFQALWREERRHCGTRVQGIAVAAASNAPVRT